MRFYKHGIVFFYITCIIKKIFLYLPEIRDNNPGSNESLNFKKMEIVFDKREENAASQLTKAEMMMIQGGRAQAAKFTCNCTDANGQTITAEVDSIQECWDLC